MSRRSDPELPPVLSSWFRSRRWKPFDYQREVWRGYRSGQSGLVHAATGTGKTLAAWMGPLIEALEEQQGRRVSSRGAAPPLRVLWITPLRALASDTAAALADPLAASGLSWTIETR